MLREARDYLKQTRATLVGFSEIQRSVWCSIAMACGRARACVGEPRHPKREVQNEFGSLRGKL